MARHVPGAEQPHDEGSHGAGWLLPGAQAHRGALCGWRELYLEFGGRGEAGCWLAIEALGDVPPSDDPGRIPGDDLLVDLGRLATPTTILAAPLADSCAGQDLDPSAKVNHSAVRVGELTSSETLAGADRTLASRMISIIRLPRVIISRV